MREQIAQQTYSQTDDYEPEDDDSLYITRSPSSARRYQPPGQQVAQPFQRPMPAQPPGTPPIQRRNLPQPVAQRGRTFVEPVTTTGNQPRIKRTFSFPGWMIVIGIAVIVMIVGYVAFNFIGSSWQHWQDDLHFGNPRTYQTDYVVGHSDNAAHPTHFIAVNLKGHIKVIELPGGSSKDSHIFDVTYLEGQGAEYIPVTLSFQNTNGRVDMYVSVGNATYIYTNTGTTFQLATQP